MKTVLAGPCVNTDNKVEKMLLPDWPPDGGVSFIQPEWL